MDRFAPFHMITVGPLLGCYRTTMSDCQARSPASKPVPLLLLLLVLFSSSPFVSSSLQRESLHEHDIFSTRCLLSLPHLLPPRPLAPCSRSTSAFQDRRAGGGRAWTTRDLLCKSLCDPLSPLQSHPLSPHAECASFPSSLRLSPLPPNSLPSIYLRSSGSSSLSTKCAQQDIRTACSPTTEGEGRALATSFFSSMPVRVAEMRTRHTDSP
jgi:hypothetical protein